MGKIKELKKKTNVLKKNNKSTYRTKLKLDKEVGGGDFSELRTVTYLITYPYGWTVNFEIWNLRFKHRGTKYGMLLTTHQPPIAKTSQTSAWSHRYIGNWVGKTEGSPIGFIPIFWRLKSWIIPAANPTNSSHPVTSSQRCIARRFVNGSHGWCRQQRPAFGKQIHWFGQAQNSYSFLFKKWSIWRILDLWVVRKQSQAPWTLKPWKKTLENSGNIENFL